MFFLLKCVRQKEERYFVPDLRQQGKQMSSHKREQQGSQRTLYCLSTLLIQIRRWEPRPCTRPVIQGRADSSRRLIHVISVTARSHSTSVRPYHRDHSVNTLYYTRVYNTRGTGQRFQISLPGRKTYRQKPQDPQDLTYFLMDKICTRTVEQYQRVQ